MPIPLTGVDRGPRALAVYPTDDARAGHDEGFAPVDVDDVIAAVHNSCNYRCFFCIGAGANNEPPDTSPVLTIARQKPRVDSSVERTAAPHLTREFTLVSVKVAFGATVRARINAA